MPEGHTIHRLARDQTKTIARQRLHITSPQGRFAADARRIDGRRLARIEAAGKHLFYHFGKDLILHVHLGLFGRYRTHENPPPAPRGAVRVRFEGNKKTIDLNGPNQCELIDREGYESILARLGPDPLRADANPDRAWRRIHASRAPIGLLLMDQSVIAGIGNIYRSEILHRLRIHPLTPGKRITRKQFDELWALASRLLALGVKHNRIITIDQRDFPHDFPRDIAKTPRRKLLRVFKKPHCPTCAGALEQFKMASRKVFACPVCQVLPPAPPVSLRHSSSSTRRSRAAPRSVRNRS